MSGFLHSTKMSARLYHGAVVFVFVAVRTPHILLGADTGLFPLGQLQSKLLWMCLHKSLDGRALSPLRFTTRVGVAGFGGPVHLSVKLWKILPKTCMLP